MSWAFPDAHKGLPQSAVLSLAALGVVFGDIGTSPMYALHAAFGANVRDITPDHVRGVLSLVFWALLLVVGLKYIIIVMRADNSGEGGVMSLLARAIGSDHGAIKSRRRTGLIVAAVCGAALMYGDGVITPAISVLAAVEGVAVFAPQHADWVLPIAVAVVLVVFLMQRAGSGLLGVVLGPIMLLWFAAIALIGLLQIINTPMVLRSLSPEWAVHLFQRDPGGAFVLMGAIVLVITGTEAMFADMGHFGRRSIARAWWWVVMPALLLSYLGQGAAALAAGDHMDEVIAHPFWAAVPGGLVLPMTVLATVAALIAAQAVITGGFSLTRQLIQQRLLPPVRVRHTSQDVEGQVFLPAINRIMCVLVVLVMVGFRSSAALADAYGLAVSGMFLVTTLLFCVVARRQWRWSLPLVGLFLLCFLAIDRVFVIANAEKFLTGGWLPLAIASVVLLVVWTWRRGTNVLRAGRLEDGLHVEAFLEHAASTSTRWEVGTGIFLTGDPAQAPVALRKLHRHTNVLPDTLVLLHIRTLSVPYVPKASQVGVKQLDEHVWRVVCRLGWRDTIDVPDLVRRAAEQGIDLDMKSLTYWTRREGVGAARHKHIAVWQRGLLNFLLQTSPSSADLLGLPGRRTMEIVVRGKV